MATSVKLFVLVLAIAAAGAAKSPTTFDTKYDNIDIDAIIKSDRLLMSYIKCILDKGKCTPEGVEVKKSIPSALVSDCSQCSPKQKENARKVIHHLLKNKPSVYRDLEKKFDPTGSYRKKYEAELLEASKPKQKATPTPSPQTSSTTEPTPTASTSKPEAAKPEEAKPEVSKV